MREDLVYLRYAVDHGWEPEYHYEDRWHKRTEAPQYAVGFKKGTKHVWSIKQGWQTADLIDGKFQNHAPFSLSLKEVLDILDKQAFQAREDKEGGST